MNIPDSDLPTIRSALRGPLRCYPQTNHPAAKSATFAKPKPRITTMQNKPKSKKTNSMGADHDKLTEALRKRGLLMPALGMKSKEAKRISRKVREDYDE